MEVDIYNMIYKKPKTFDKLRILGEKFVINNENKGNIIIHNKREKIKSIIPIKNSKRIKIKMVLIKNINNISCIFKDCELLESFSYKNLKQIKDNIINEKNMDIIDNESINLINYLDNNINSFDSSCAKVLM